MGDEPTLTDIHVDVQTTMRLAQKMDKLLTGGDELNKGLIYEHNKTRGRVEVLEKTEAVRRKWVLTAVTAAIGSVAAGIWTAFKAKFGG